MNFNLNGNDQYAIKGIIDRLDHDGNGNWEIHDYKSGKRALTQNQADKDIQLALYQIGLESKEKDIKSVKLVWHFLQHGIKVESNRNSMQLMSLSNSIMKRIDILQNNIANETEFYANESILCNWCYYWEECPLKSRANPYIK